MKNKIEKVLQSIEYDVIGNFNGKVEKKFAQYVHKEIGNLSKTDAVILKKLNCVDPYGLIFKCSQNNALQSNVRMVLITSAWKTQDYIQQLLDSIENNSMHPSIVLIGVDGCFDTAQALSVILKSKHYSFNTKVFLSKKNVGTYNIRNNLIDLAFDAHQADAVICIDSDDMIHSDYIRCIHDVFKENKECVIAPNIIFNFNHNNGSKHSIMSYGVGINSFNKQAWKKIGYFLPFRAAADNEWINRCLKLGVKVLVSNSLVYYRRMHANQLTKKFKVSNNDPERSKSYLIRDSDLIIHPRIEKIDLMLIVDQ
jgi:cellulose synthase/poly-beta-1,6-N-acetylglucosamine synthase-like glycosyltransferase